MAFFFASADSWRFFKESIDDLLDPFGCTVGIFVALECVGDDDPGVSHAIAVRVAELLRILTSQFVQHGLFERRRTATGGRRGNDWHVNGRRGYLDCRRSACTRHVSRGRGSGWAGIVRHRKADTRCLLRGVA